MYKNTDSYTTQNSHKPEVTYISFNRNRSRNYVFMQWKMMQHWEQTMYKYIILGELAKYNTEWIKSDTKIDGRFHLYEEQEKVKVMDGNRLLVRLG